MLTLETYEAKRRRVEYYLTHRKPRLAAAAMKYDMMDDLISDCLVEIKDLSAPTSDRQIEIAILRAQEKFWADGYYQYSILKDDLQSIEETSGETISVVPSPYDRLDELEAKWGLSPVYAKNFRLLLAGRRLPKVTASRTRAKVMAAAARREDAQ